MGRLRDKLRGSEGMSTAGGTSTSFGHKAEGGQIYKMQERLVSIGDDYWIENKDGERAFFIDGKALRIRETLDFKDVKGNDLYKIREKMIRVRDTMDIEDAEGRTAASVKKALITPLRDRFKVEVANGPEMDVQGNILRHEYSIEAGGGKVAEVSKRWFRVRDTYGVEISPGQDDALILAITVALDQMVHD